MGTTFCQSICVLISRSDVLLFKVSEETQTIVEYDSWFVGGYFGNFASIANHFYKIPVV